MAKNVPKQKIKLEKQEHYKTKKSPSKKGEK